MLYSSNKTSWMTRRSSGSLLRNVTATAESMVVVAHLHCPETTWKQNSSNTEQVQTK